MLQAIQVTNKFIDPIDGGHIYFVTTPDNPDYPTLMTIKSKIELDINRTYLGILPSPNSIEGYYYRNQYPMFDPNPPLSLL